MKAGLVHVSKFLSYVLRHAPESIGLSLDREGWASIESLLALGQPGCSGLTLPSLLEVVAQNDKRRFELSTDGLRVRAVQGHSTASVNRAFTAKTPPVTLFHGTAEANLASIRKRGLLAQSRHHVHLSSTRETAVSVGARHGKPVVLTVDAKAMLAAGAKFFQAENGVWLTEAVAPGYLLFPAS